MFNALIRIFYDSLTSFNAVITIDMLIVNKCNSINSLLTFKPFEFLSK